MSKQHLNIKMKMKVESINETMWTLRKNDITRPLTMREGGKSFGQKRSRKLLLIINIRAKRKMKRKKMPTKR